MIRTCNLLIRSQMLYPIELRVRLEKGDTVALCCRMSRRGGGYRRQEKGYRIGETEARPGEPWFSCPIDLLSPVFRFLYSSRLVTRVVLAQRFAVGLKHANDFAQSSPQRTCVAVAEVFGQDQIIVALLGRTLRDVQKA